MNDAAEKSGLLSLDDKSSRREIFAAPRSGGFYERLVLDAFRKMSLGCLRLTLPDGHCHIFGDSAEENPANLHVLDAAFFQRCVLFGDIGFGESYVAGEWETDSIERVISWAILNVENAPALSGSRTRVLALNLLKSYNRFLHRLRPNSLQTSPRNISEHYDLGNDFYRLWLDPSMTYSSAYFTRNTLDLEEAQSAKYDALCRKLHLRSSDHVLEIGSGWGGFAVHAVQKYGCRVTTVTISQEQYRFAQERFDRAGIADRVEIRLQDYRSIEGQFSKIVSIEMMEAIGDQFLETYCAKIHELLAPDGLAGLQYITVPDCRHTELKRGVDWIQKHIFPGSLLLSVGRVNAALNRTSDLFLHHLEDLGTSYARTLHAWWETFNQRLSEVEALGFDAAFVRKWNYYLQYCEAAFASRNISVVQAIYTRPNNRSLHTTTR